MKKTVGWVVFVALATTGCKKKEEAGAAPPGAAKPAEMAPAGSARQAAKPAAAGRSCADLGGTQSGTSCILTTAPFKTEFTGKFDTGPHGPPAGAVFKITSNFDRPVKITSMQLYSYDKAGTQIDLEAQGQKAKYGQDSGMFFALEPGQTKEYIVSAGKDNAPGFATLQLEIMGWKTDDGGDYMHKIPNFDVRPKDGWK